MSGFKPLLSAKIFSTKPGETEKNFSLLRFPVACSIKYDGIRLLEHKGEMHTRSLKIVRNYHVRAETKRLIDAAAQEGVTGLDGEIIVGSPRDPNAMQNTTSGVMSYEGTPEFTLLVFDSYQNASTPFTQRHQRVEQLLSRLHNQFPWVVLVEQFTAHNLQELLAYEDRVLAMGYEGIMVRSLDGPYKFGRSSMREGILTALKRFVDDEAVILEILEELENTNPQEENELGRSKRSGHQANLIPKGRMGTMICRSPKFEESFRLGGGRGITFAVRQEIWDNPEKYLSQPVKYIYQDIGVKDRPRLPRIVGFRSYEDMGLHDSAVLRQLATGYLPTGKGKA